MAISKGFRYKDKEGKVTDYEYGVNGSNVTQDSEHRLVTDEEKQTWNDKADLEDIPSGSAASHAVANNCTTTQAGSVLDARQGKVLMDKANQLSSDITEIGLSTTASSGNFSNTSIAPNVLTELTGYVNYSGNVLVDVNVFGWMAKNDGVYIEIVNEYSTIKQADYVASKEGRNDFHVILFSSTPSITIKVKHDSTSSRTFGATTNAIRI